MLQSGDNTGITLAESPLMRKALMKIKPKSSDIALCLAIIRPAAKDARIKDNDIDYETEFVYDDDAIKLLSNELNARRRSTDKYVEDLLRKESLKEDKINFVKKLNKLKGDSRQNLLNKLSNLRKYSFCKSHSYSYAQLVYKLAYEKTHNLQ